MRGEVAQGGGQAGHCGWIGALVAGGERYSAAGGLLDRGLAGEQLDGVEDLPVRGLDLGLGVDWDLGEQVAGAVGLCRFKLVACWQPMRCRGR